MASPTDGARTTVRYHGRHESVEARRLTSAEADGARRLRNEFFFSAPQLKRDPLDGAHALMSGQMRLRTVGPDSPGQCEPGLSDDRPRDPRLCYCPELSPRATRSSSS